MYNGGSAVVVSDEGVSKATRPFVNKLLDRKSGRKLFLGDFLAKGVFLNGGFLGVIRIFGNLQKGDRMEGSHFRFWYFPTRVLGGGTVTARGRTRTLSVRRTLTATVRGGRLCLVS